MAYKYNHVHNNAPIKEMSLKLLRLSKADKARYKKMTCESANMVGEQMSRIQQLVDEGGYTTDTSG